MEELKKNIKDLAQKIKKAIQKLKLREKEKELKELKEQMSAPNFWQEREAAQEIILKFKKLEKEIKAWQILRKEIKDLEILIKDKEAFNIKKEIVKDYNTLKDLFTNNIGQLYFQGKYDNFPALITIKSGAGGVDAQDWSALLERMYLKFAEHNNYTINYLSRSPGSEAGIKSTTFKVSGEYAYGYLKNEKGVHRLVRISPFDADQARHTSFSLVEVLPELKEVDIKIKEEDLKIDTFKASGHGGQSVNTTDSAVRLTHLPTGLKTLCQNERSQSQNKLQALAYLKSKLQLYYETELEEEKKALQGEYTKAAWGNQIRSYILQPYKLVKDHRSNYESNDPEYILNGNIMEFIKAQLEKR